MFLLESYCTAHSFARSLTHSLLSLWESDATEFGLMVYPVFSTVRLMYLATSEDNMDITAFLEDKNLCLERTVLALTEKASYISDLEERRMLHDTY